jgi:hypothetical protein
MYSSAVQQPTALSETVTDLVFHFNGGIELLESILRSIAHSIAVLRTSRRLPTTGVDVERCGGSFRSPAVRGRWRRRRTAGPVSSPFGPERGVYE